MFVRRNFQLYELVYIQHSEKRIPNQVMKAYERRIIATMERDFWPEMWGDMKQFYTDDFVQYVSCLNSNKSEAAKLKPCYKCGW